MADRNKLIEIQEKIKLGVKLAFERLWQQAAKNNEELIISQNGKIVKVKARDIINPAA